MFKQLNLQRGEGCRFEKLKHCLENKANYRKGGESGEKFFQEL